ncbi:hypothetical protein GWK47_055065 [Chionoecetes opilio]|uniref:Uncharacterized protein n=1 Tax=Chionoecetes opilio TaxID=41210 RepID=A0A8J4XZW8_CHIOP|nr:hypothetical protein GWK47_055065 [Chionoecetes opilio]
MSGAGESTVALLDSKLPFREYTCLGDWFVGRNHYFVASNTKESRREERYRCFVRDREEDLYMGLSMTPECSVLNTPQNSPIRFRLSYAKHEVVTSGCYLPRNLTGRWQSTGPGEAQMVINATDIRETTWRGYAAKTTSYTCLEQRGDRYLMAKLSVEGCQTEYVCWELVPRHHNIVRYRVSWALIYQDFQVCDSSNFRSGRVWKYDTLIADSPTPISCPFSGRFVFQQVGGSPLLPRIVGGITSSPLDSYPCPVRRTVMSVCDSERKLIEIDLDLCVSLNKDGHPIDFNSVTDYRLQCVGYWQENMLSYLVTHDPSDSVSRFRCWVYQRVSDTQIRLSQSVGAACGLRQTFLSSNYSESAAVAFTLTLRIHGGSRIRHSPCSGSPGVPVSSASPAAASSCSPSWCSLEGESDSSPSHSPYVAVIQCDLPGGTLGVISEIETTSPLFQSGGTCTIKYLIATLQSRQHATCESWPQPQL